VTPETWKPAPGWVGVYEVSDAGRVRRVRAYRSTAAGWVMKLNLGKNGYLRVCLQDRPRISHCLVHRLVAMAFLPMTDGRTLVNHKDRNKANNAVSNMEWCNNSENVRHSMGIIGNWMIRGEAHVCAKLTNEQADYIRQSTERGVDLSRKFGVSQQTVCCIRKGRLHKVRQ